MAKQTKMTAEEYVVERLVNAETLNKSLETKIKCLEEDLNGFLKIKEHFKIERTTGENDLKLVFYLNPGDKYCYTDIMAFANSLDPVKMNNKFITLVQLLKLQDSLDNILVEIKDETTNATATTESD